MHETLRLSTPGAIGRKCRPWPGASRRPSARSAVLFFVLLGSDVEIVVKPRPEQRADRARVLLVA